MGLGKTQRLDEFGNPIDESPPSQIPPPPEKDFAERHPVSGHRTPSRPLEASDLLASLPADAPGWMRRAVRMIAGLHAAVQQGTISPSGEASIERAWAAWELDGSTNRQISRVALLCEQAHGRLRASPQDKIPQTAELCATLVQRGLPGHRRQKVSYQEVVAEMHTLAREADAWVAIVNCTANLLGWTGMGGAHAAHAVRVAIVESRQKGETGPLSSEG